MNPNMEEEDKLVTMLLNIDSFYGESDSRLGPTVKMLCIGLAPALLWIWTGFPLPTWLFVPIQVIWFIRVAMMTVGREKQRLNQFRKQLHDDYSAASELLNIKTIHPDGCVEYTNGRVCYIMVAANGTSYNALSRSKTLRDFMSLLGKDFDIDFYIQNVTEMKSLEERYNDVKLFVDQDAAKDFIDIIDHNRKVVYGESRLTRICIVVAGRKEYWTDIRDNCKMACMSSAARAFKNVHMASREEIGEILNTDIRGYIDTEKILQQKYATHKYYGSKVLYYGDAPENVEDAGDQEERGFLIPDE